MVSDRTPLFIAVPRTVHIWRGAPCNAKCIMCTYGYFKGEELLQISQVRALRMRCCGSPLVESMNCAVAEPWFPTWAANPPPAGNDGMD